MNPRIPGILVLDSRRDPRLQNVGLLIICTRLSSVDLGLFKLLLRGKIKPHDTKQLKQLVSILLLTHTTLLYTLRVSIKHLLYYSTTFE